MLADGGFQGLAFDWITGNLYIGTRRGTRHIIVCDTSATRSFTCFPLLEGQKDVDGIALDPIQGYSNDFQCLAATIIAQKMPRNVFRISLGQCTGQAIHRSVVQFGAPTWMVPTYPEVSWG